MKLKLKGMWLFECTRAASSKYLKLDFRFHQIFTHMDVHNDEHKLHANFHYVNYIQFFIYENAMVNACVTAEQKNVVCDK